MSGLTQLFLCQIIHTEHFSELLGEKSVWSAQLRRAAVLFLAGSLGRIQEDELLNPGGNSSSNNELSRA